MKEDICSYELSFALKKAGFDEPCIAHWACEPDGKPMLVGSTAFVFNNSELKGRDVVAPLLWQAQKWMRDKCGLHVNVIPYVYYAEDADGRRCDEWHFWDYDIECIATATIEAESNTQFDTYEQALLEGIKATLDLINPEKK